MNFYEFAASHGLEIRELYPSDKIRRCGTREKPRSDNGAYFYDGHKGWVQDWANAGTPIWWQSDRKWTDEEKRQWAMRRQTMSIDKDRRYELAASRADIMLRSAELLQHDYLHRKGFPEAKGLVLEGRLMVPMRNVRTNALQGLQTIFWDPEARVFEKKMLPGMRAKEGVLRMGAGEEVWLVEGYATGLSVHAALRSVGLNAQVVVAFSAGSLIDVAGKIPGRRYVFADHDASEAGQKAAESTGLPWTMSEVQGEDANDLHKRTGLFSVVAKIMALRAQS